MKPRTIHYAGQQLIVGTIPEPGKGQEAAPAPVSRYPHMVKAIAAVIAIAAVLLMARAARAATPVASGTPGVTIVPVFVSSAPTISAAGQIVLSSRTTTTNKVFYLTHLDVSGFLAVPSTSTTLSLGTVSIQSPTATVVATMTFTNSASDSMSRWVLDFAEPLPFASQVTVSLNVNQTTASGVTWISNLIGYEK